MSSLEARLIDNAEVEELQNRIDSLDNEDAMDAGVMDGFLTAMAINPGSSSDEDVLPFIFSDQGDPSAIPDDARLLELIGLRRKEIQAALNAKGGLDPIIFPLVDDDGNTIEDEEGIEAIVPWSIGFRIGCGLWPESAFESDAVSRSLVPILRPLTLIDDDETEADKGLEEILATPGAKPAAKNLTDALYDLVEAVFELKAVLRPNEPARRATPKIGRNDPCPCGSGKKFKQCCGKAD